MAANNDWTREGLAWAAGLFEGEGCIAHSKPSKSRPRHQWFLVVASTDLDVLERLSEVTGMGSITGPFERGSNKVHWVWRVTRREHVYALLAALYPWLGKRRQERAFECLRHMNENPSQKQRIAMRKVS